MQASKAKAALVLSSTSLLLFLAVISLSGVKENVKKPSLVVVLDQSPSLSAAVAAAVTKQLRRRFAEEDKDLEEVCSRPPFTRTWFLPSSRVVFILSGDGG
jgi:hypothetical protein